MNPRIHALRKKKRLKTPNLYAALSGDLSSLNSPKTHGEAATSDLFEKPIPEAIKKKKPLRTQNRPSEAQVQKTILQGLKYHPSVAWAGRYNSGGTYNADDRYVAFNSVAGQSDIMGQLIDGRLLAIEVKAPGGKATEMQHRFLDRVSAHNGIACVASSWDDVVGAINAAFLTKTATLPLPERKSALNPRLNTLETASTDTA